ncbi:HNH endonuclease family protein [Streptomyces sp. NPDC021100]|uniref:HNH endonuclease family protein n=1 Tax=Streptomyces sp. NPDC021100 TaxID=3365114 RepID=UPI0037A3119E
MISAFRRRPGRAVQSRPRAALATSLLLGALAGCSGAHDGPFAGDAKAAAIDAAAKPGTAMSALTGLPVKRAASKAGYDRVRDFGPPWSDDTSAPGSHNHCDTRNDILHRDLRNPVLQAGSKCVIASGTLDDPYTGKVIRFQRGRQSSAVQIDHLVALSDGWRTGAQQLTQDQREAMANDPLNLLAVDGPTNQAKGDRDASEWLPPRKAFDCSYVARQIAVKRQYRLWVTPAENEAMKRVLASCPAQPLPTEDSPGVALRP